MLKHMLTTACPRKCEYCITRNVHAREERDLGQIEKVYRGLSQRHREIMLTGGEPTLVKNFRDTIGLAIHFFSKVYLTTQNPVMLKPGNGARFFDAITFSIHDEKIPTVEYPTSGQTDLKVYAAILAKRYTSALPYDLKHAGYNGLTVNEDQRDTKSFEEWFPMIKDFSFRINRHGKCMNETIILPDLTVINNFTPYL